MATVDKKSAERIIANNGYWFGSANPPETYEDEIDAIDQDPRCIRIVEYTTHWGQKAYGLVFEGEDVDRYNRPTDYVIDPKTIWVYKRSESSNQT